MAVNTSRLPTTPITIISEMTIPPVCPITFSGSILEIVASEVCSTLSRVAVITEAVDSK